MQSVDGAKNGMQMEFHQLDRRLELLRVQRPEEQRRLLASLAASGQQNPIVVVAAAEENHYLVIDGFQRIRALEQLGRDIVEAVIWPLSEAEALLLDQSLRSGQQPTALEQGWLLKELEQHHSYGREDLARRFDRSLSWVSRRLGLAEQLPAGVQEQVRRGAIQAQVAMKCLVPMARTHRDDCVRMAEGIAKYKLNSREAGQLYTAWRKASPKVRARILEQPDLFVKTQRVVAEEPPENPPLPLIKELERNLDLMLTLARRMNRDLRGATVELDPVQCEQMHDTIAKVEAELSRLQAKIPQFSAGERGGEDVESAGESRDSGTREQGSEQARDRACDEHQPEDGESRAAIGPGRSAEGRERGDVCTLAGTDPSVTWEVQRKSDEGLGRVSGERSEGVLLGTDGLLQASWDRAGAGDSSGPLSLSSGIVMESFPLRS
jgi:ParB family transcriptional regulator, chromosome partitioning protein